MKYVTMIGKVKFEIEITADGTLLVNGQPRVVDFTQLEDAQYSLIKDYEAHGLVLEDNSDGGVDVLMQGRMYSTQVLDERALMMANRKGGLKSNSGDVISPMPGLIVQVLVAPGDTVHEGQTVVILESMKMQNELKSPRDGVVGSVSATQGKTVEKGAVLVQIAEAPAS